MLVSVGQRRKVGRVKDFWSRRNWVMIFSGSLEVDGLHMYPACSNNREHRGSGTKETDVTAILKPD